MKRGIHMKKVIISILAILAVFAVATMLFAQDSNASDIINQLKQEGNIPKNNIPENQNVENIESGNVENQNLNTNLNTNKNTNKNENLPTTTPHTGIGDYSSFIFIGVFAVSAVYAYKKVKEYNV